MSESPPPPPPVASRGRLILARVLTVVAVLLVVIFALANFVKREALDESRFRSTSRDLIADPTIRDEVAATLVDRLYANVDVAAALRQRLPDNLAPLAGPVAGGLREAVERSARRLLEQGRVQDAFVNASSAAQRQFVAVLDGKTRVLETSGGRVVLDVRPLVLELGNRFSFISDLESRLPANAAQVTILKSDQLKTAQRGTRLLRFVADWIWVFTLATAAAAVWLARGRRRIEVRALAIGLLVGGMLILVVHTLLGRYLVDHLVTNESAKPAVASAYSILTELFSGAGWTAIIIALVGLVGIWLCGPRPRAVTARRELAPYLVRPEIAYSVVVFGYFLLLWWRPTPQFGFPLTVVIWFVLALLGLEVLRRQTAREFPDAEPRDLSESLSEMFGRARARRSSEGGATDQLERLARLHRDGALDDAEFKAAKTRLLA
jgi:hypothetical protein